MFPKPSLFFIFTLFVEMCRKVYVSGPSSSINRLVLLGCGCWDKIESEAEGFDFCIFEFLV